MRYVRRTLSLVSFAALLAAGDLTFADVDAPSIRYDLDIPSEELTAALQSFAIASNHRLLYKAELTAGKTSRAIKGHFTAREAIEALLSGTGLTYEITGASVVLIKKQNDKTVATVPMSATASQTASSGSPDDTNSGKEGKNNSSGEFRTARVDQGSTSQSSTVGIDTSASRYNPAKSQIEEIVVTAQKREQPLEDVPLSITAITGESLQETGAQSFQDYLNGIAGVSFWSNGGQSNEIFIRGVSGGLNLASAPTTGVYIDEAPISQSVGGTVDLNPFDLDRVEVLRGPQGTLYGASSMGGTVRIILNKPKLDTFEAGLDGSVSNTDAANYNVNGMVNIPLVADSLAVRLTAGYRDLSGFIDDSGLGRNHINFDRLTTARAQLRWKPVERADVLLSVSYQNEEYGYHPYAFVGAGYGPYDANYAYPDYGEQPFYLYGLTVKYDLGFADITSATNYSKKEATNTGDVTGLAPEFGVTPGPGQGLGFYATYDSKVFTQELRVASKQKGRINWLVGAYYESGTPPNLSAYVGTNIPSLAGVDLYTSSGDGNQRQRAAFGEIGYEILPSLTVTAGVRESHYETYSRTLQTGILAGGADLLSYSSARSQFTDKRYAIDYQIAADHLLYAQAASGSRPGVATGVDALPQQCLAQLPSLGYATPPMVSSPDDLWTYEAGSKNTFADRRVTLNGSAYYTQWRDVQALVYLDCGFSFNGNAGAARIRGVELESSARLIDPLLLTLSAAYTDSQITQSNVGLGAIAGDPLPLVPKFNGSVSVRYDVPLFVRVRSYVGADATYVGDQLADFQGRPTGFLIDSYVLANARIGFLKDNYEVALFATNLTDRRIVTYEQISPTRETLLRPRTVGIDLKTHF